MSDRHPAKTNSGRPRGEWGQWTPGTSVCKCSRPTQFIQNVHVKKCKQNWLSSTKCIQLFGGKGGGSLAPEPHQSHWTRLPPDPVVSSTDNFWIRGQSPQQTKFFHSVLLCFADCEPESPVTRVAKEVHPVCERTKSMTVRTTKLRYREEHSASVVLSWCTLWHFSRKKSVDG